jgi:GT2 family glycosyltransferase
MSTEHHRSSDRCRVAAVVVTYNRRELLQECLAALSAQTRPLDEIVVIDNASTDGTDKTVTAEFPHITYVRMKENIGGAGGFHEGMKLAYRNQHDWIWMMDDDAVPYPDALETLLTASSLMDEKVGFLCSQVVWTDGSPHGMNVPRPCGNYSYNDQADKGLVRVAACSFVSIAVPREVVKAVGLPIKEFFIHGDDIEFTERISKQFPCYHVLRSKVVHKTNMNVGARDPIDRLWRYFYMVRNTTYIHRRRGWGPLIKLYLKKMPLWFVRVFKLKNHRFVAMKFFFRGLAAGMFFNPEIERV